MTDDADEDGLVRLQKLLAQSGVASRRRCEELMLAGLVEVDGEVVTRLGTKVDPATAVIRVEGRRLPPVSPHVYLALSKPRGVVSTMSDPGGRRSLGDLVADRPERLFHVAEVAGVVGRVVLRRLREGVVLEDGPVEVSSCRVLSTHQDRSIVELVIHEGRNRIVRRLLDEVGHPVRRLTRTAIGPVLLRGLRSGELRDLTRDELGELLDAARL
jgi:23S rRNA pseudouridine2605 synthase